MDRALQTTKGEWEHRLPEAFLAYIEGCGQGMTPFSKGSQLAHVPGSSPAQRAARPVMPQRHGFLSRFCSATRSLRGLWQVTYPVETQLAAQPEREGAGGH